MPHNLRVPAGDSGRAIIHSGLTISFLLILQGGQSGREDEICLSDKNEGTNSKRWW